MDYLLIYQIIMAVLNISLTIFNLISLSLMAHVLFFRFKILSHNPYRTSPICLVTLSMAFISILLLDIHFFLRLFIDFKCLLFIWITIALNLWVALYTFIVWKGTNIRSLVIHINMILNALYFLLAILDNTLANPQYYILPFIGLASAILTQVILNKKKYVPAPRVIPKILENLVKEYINIFKNRKEEEYLQKLSNSRNEFVSDHAKRTLELYKLKRISRSNMKNNLFLLLLIDNDISIGKFRKIFYDIKQRADKL